MTLPKSTCKDTNDKHAQYTQNNKKIKIKHKQAKKIKQNKKPSRIRRGERLMGKKNVFT